MKEILDELLELIWGSKVKKKKPKKSRDKKGRYTRRSKK